MTALHTTWQCTVFNCTALHIDVSATPFNVSKMLKCLIPVEEKHLSEPFFVCRWEEITPELWRRKFGNIRPSNLLPLFNILQTNQTHLHT